ncbi:hypothetical protein GIB67_022506 [Kingdonia uniflora]|uniref:Peptidase S8/S53 domain-containing protein n=1 Tax=Kingdonia uniflora TaxID=39325 RepID=A0A7J7L7A4_9MAGN|nr:hypothetical protein GIB67_022506 [Kingdonia uniflora]
MDQALVDGVDTISMSMSFRRALPYENPVSIVLFAAMEKGVLVFSSAGNRGSNLMTVVGNPWSLAVGVGTIDRQLAGTLTLRNGKTFIGWSINNQISTVIESTLTGVIFISTDEREEYRIPGFTIKPMDATPTVINYAKSTIDPKATIKFRQTSVRWGEKCVPQILKYSSRRPSQNYRGILKPNVVAPRSQVLAAWSPKVATSYIGRNNLFMSRNYNIFSRTSITCPYASGVVVLLKGVHAYWSPTTIRLAMMITTNPLDNTNNPIFDVEFLRPVRGLDMGASQIDPNKALNPGLTYDVGVQNYVNYICSFNFIKE